MKIEVGKFYQCRDGSKAIIYAVHEVREVFPYPIHGAVWDDTYLLWDIAIWPEWIEVLE